MEVMKEVIGKLQENIEKSNGSVEEMQCIFYETAKELMNECMLKIEDKENNKVLEIELKEIEFYFFDCKHPDIYTHLDRLQKKCCKLYVHKKIDGRGGIDITFGNDEYYGGILIRGIEIKEEYISGPANVRKFIIDYFNKYDYRELSEFFSDNNKCEIKLLRKDKKNLLLHSRRVGLNFELEPTYANALYRIIDLDYLKDTKRHKNKKNVPEITKAEVISIESGIINSEMVNNENYNKKNIINPRSKSYKDELKKINKILLDNIKLFKQKLQEKECIKNKGTE